MPPRRFLYAGAGLASFLLFLLANIPAGALTGLLESRLSGNIRVSGVDGTIWNGSLRSISIHGWRLTATQWDLNPAGLLLGRLSARIETRIAGGELTTDLTAGMSGTLALRDLEADGPVQPIAAAINLPAAGGRYRVEISALTIEEGWPASLVGKVRVASVPLSLTGDSAGARGNFVVEFDAGEVPQDGRLIGTLSDEDGPLEVGGTIVLLPPNRYEFQAGLQARPGAPAEIAQALSLAGPAGPDGRREISLSGTL